MSDSPTTPLVAYHVVLHSDEVPVAATALRLRTSDEVHQRSRARPCAHPTDDRPWRRLVRRRTYMGKGIATRGKP
jgi:hypothetical protein